MKQEEYVKTIVVNGHMINVGLDDYGQSYFLEYLNDAGELEEECVGCYVTDYLDYAEYLFGNKLLIPEFLDEAEVGSSVKRKR